MQCYKHKKDIFVAVMEEVNEAEVGRSPVIFAQMMEYKRQPNKEKKH